MEGNRSDATEELGLLEFIRSSPELAEFINRPMDQGLDDDERARLVEKRLKILRPYANNPDIHEAVRADFNEALTLTRDLPTLLAGLLESKKYLEANLYSRQEAILLAGGGVKRQYEKTGMPQLWDDAATEVFAFLHKAVGTDATRNLVEEVGNLHPDESKARNITRMIFASTVLMRYKQVLNFQGIRVNLCELAPIYDSLFYGGVLGGIGGRYQRNTIRSRIREASVAVVIEEIPIPGLGLLKELATLLYDLLNFDTLFARDAENIAAISKYLKSYLQALRIVGSLASTLADVESGTSDTFAEIIGFEPSELEQRLVSKM